MNRAFEYRSGLKVLGWCVVAVAINSVLFAEPMGHLGHPVMPVRSIGLPVNIIGLIVGWIAFVFGSYKGVPQKIAAIVLISIINFFLVCNLWNVILLNG